ncbi:ATP-binding protein [Streptomyces radicis]|uniref:Tetratricopeptide repeat protein n=1 Tax=Streptomyces radicis TaxID=1750517 RepID=A0A3A9WB66_9ACTN|nr:tetratricopeptide repeat protein [Streptomyces radicis]RKN04846.1 tetratricopeptide repeat protein [Streptomyces radicis]RKN25356.1 tetratricopeptide repeat protein [Streptomyces radicis]
MGDTSGHINRVEGRTAAHSVVQARDIDGGVHIHQPPERPPAVIPHQLRGGIRHFVNRSRELSRLGTLIADHGAEPHASRVAVITGTAGVGKTTLALHWAHAIRSYFPGGELYANLRGYTADSPMSSDEVLGRFLEDLGMSATQVPTARDRRETLFRSLMADRRMLVFLDNAADSAHVRPLLPGTAASLVLITSRDDLTALVTQHDAVRVRVTTFPTTDAVALLRATTADDRPGDQGSDLTELARMCGGLPLALRIAAERAAGWPTMPLGELIDELRDETARWTVLTADPEEGPEEGTDAMRSVFEWSYRALPAPAARLFRLLGLHPGNEFGLAAVASLAALEPARARALLETLVRAHLVQRRPGERYELHDLLRAYARELVRREESEADRSAILARALAWYLRTADAAQRAIAPHDRCALDDHAPASAAALTFDDYESAFRWYQAESANLVAATRVAADAGFPGIAWRLAVALRAIHMHHNAFDAWGTTARIALDAARASGEEIGEAEALENLGKVAFQASRLEEAEECHRGALAIRRRIGDRHGTAVSVNALGLLGLRRRRLDEAEAHFTEAVEIFRDLDDRRWKALMRGNLAETLCELGRAEEARAIVEHALADFRELGDHSGEGNALWLLSWARRASGDPEAAARAIADALSIAAEEDNQLWRAHWLAESARVELSRGNPEAALRLAHESAAMQRGLGDSAREAAALDSAGEACQALGRFDEAADLHRRAIVTYRDLDAQWRLANALAHLATALDPLGEDEQARAAREEALSLLTAFDDPRAVALTHRLAAHLGDGDRPITPRARKQ